MEPSRGCGYFRHRLLRPKGKKLSMPLIKEIEGALPLIATLPDEWQKDIALVVSKFVIAYDKSLTMTAEEQKAERDREISAALERPWPVGET
jgi:hypothetical protein